ncbi:MAG: site-specific integrase [Vampirovibrionales bacterium]|nr:site-specific integrase [Vampirovibrionales bacterium]
MPQEATTPWERLGICRATYFNWKKSGKLKEKTFPKLIKQWIQWREDGLETKPWSETYKRLQTTYLEKFLDEHSNVSFENLHAYLSKIPRSQHTKRRHIHSAVSSYSKFLYSREKMSPEQYLKIRGLYPKKPQGYEVKQRIIYQEDLQAILSEIEKAHSQYQRLLNKTIVILLSESALRASEACNLMIDDLRFSDNPTEAFIRVRHGKGDKPRLVPFSKAAQEAIRLFMGARPPIDGFIFWSFNPKHGYTRLNRSCLSRRFQNISEKCGIEFSAHSFRHYRITHWANNNRIPITVTQKWAGHGSLEVTQRYVHIRDTDALMAAFA